MDPPTLSILPILLLLILPNASTGLPCPRPCSCPQPTELHCTFRSLPNIPAAVPKHVERINLGFNSINQIPERSLAGLRKLELFMIHGNNIHSLPDGVFTDLTALQMLKMSYNKLTEINRHTLHGLWSLTRLHLDHNQLEFLHPDAFHGLTSLRMLQLEGNRLQQLHPATFATFTVMNHFPVSTLRHLYLSDNGLTSLRNEMLKTMPQLENLYLHGNPWTCDCNMRWFYDWNQTAPGVLKCKKDRALAGGQLCPACSSPRHLQREELQSVESLVCSHPIISAPGRTTSPVDDEREVLTREDFKEPLGNISLGLSDEHGNQVDLECSIADPKDFLKINWEHIDPLHLVSNISLSVDLDCPVDRERYERLWRLIAYYSSVPAHLQRGMILSRDPSLTYVYTQDSEKDAQYYTGIKINMMALPEWLMQTSIDLQLNRLHSSPKIVKLTLSTDLSKSVEMELVRRQRRTWVMIESTNRTRRGLSAIVGSQSQMNCNVHSSSQPLIQWMLPDGSKLEAPYSNQDSGLSVSSDGKLVIKAVSHTNAGIYYCTARVHGDFAVVNYFLTVYESSSPTPGEVTSITPVESFVGNPISLPCVTSGSPDAEVSWILPNSYIVHSQANSSKALVYPNGTLQIQQIQPSDTGYYKCVAMNQHGVATLVVKVNVLKRKGLVRPMRKFSATPQSAFGVNTQIKLLRQDTEESSGDVSLEKTHKTHQDPLQRKTPAVLPGGHGGQTSRTMWRRPPLLRKPMGSRVIDRKNLLENRRRLNVSKTKIDPEKWADILAKIRDRNTNNTVTPVLEQKTTTVTAQTTNHQTQVNTYRSQDFSNSYTPHMPSTLEPHVTHHTAHITNVVTSSNSRPFLLQTTSVPQHTATFWPDSINTTRDQVTTPSQENTHTDYTGVNTGGSKMLNEIEGVSRSNSMRQSYLNVNKSEANQEEPKKPLTETMTRLLQPTLADFQSEVMLTTTPTPTRRKNHSSSRNGHNNSKRRNEARRKRPNRKKQKLSDPLPTNAPVSTANPTAIVHLNIMSLEVTTAILNTTVPFTGSQEATSDPLSQQTNPGYRTATKPFTATAATHTMNSHERWAKPLLEKTSVAPLFPTTSPRETHGKTLIKSAASRRRIVATPLPPGNSSEETQKGSLSENVEPSTDRFLEGLEITLLMQTDVEKNQSGLQYTTAENEAPVILDAVKITTPKTVFEDFLFTKRFTISPIIHEEPYDEQYQGPSGEFEKVSHPVTPPIATPTITAFQTASTNVKTNRLLEDSTVKEQNNDPKMFTSKPSPTSQVSENTPATISPVFPSMTPTSNQSVPLTPTLVPTIIQIQSNPFTHKLPTNTEDALSTHRSPGGEPDLRGKPKIMRNNFQTFTVKVEADAQLPCVAQGQPKPFLSWTKAATGTYDNTRIQRFEVHSNGTLIIRKTQLPDQGQYLCTVQNQYGIDEIMINLMIVSHNPRILHPRHRDITTHLGEKVNMDCQVEGHPNPRVTWVLPTNARMTAAPLGLHSQQRVAVLSNGTLRITHALYSDRGVFKCIGNSAAGADSVTLRLHVTAFPPMIHQTKQENITQPEGSNVYIHCSATGAPLPVIRWATPDGVQLAASQIVTGLNLFVLTNGTLFIRGLNPGNAGRYECTASNAVASSKRMVMLNAMKNPFLSKASITSSSPEKTEAIYGSKVLLNCVANGEPEPRIIWRTPSKKLVDAQYSFDPRVKVFTNGTITIHSVTKDDSGDYLCVARNKMGDDYILFQVNVLTRAAKIEKKQLRSNQEVVHGGNLKVDCVASGFPNPEISWALPDGTMVNLVKKIDGGGVGRSRRYVVFDNGTLYFNDVGLPEEGDYTCYAENQLGKDEMKVRVKVKVAPSSPQIQDKDQKSVKVSYGETVTLRCIAKGEPAPVISWISPTNRVISPALDKYQVLDDGTLVVQKAQRFDGGNYTCIARNSAGHDYKIIRLEVWVTPPVINGLLGASNAIKVTAVKDQTKWLDCVAKGTPVPRIMWVLPGNVVLPAPYNSNRMTVHLNGSLEIRSPKKTDSGQLACIARNEGGEVKLLVKLDVEETVHRPQIIGPKTNSQSLTIGNAMTLNCSFEGRVKPQITWILPDGTSLQSGARFSKFFHRPDGSLIISNPSVAELGMYRCLGQNFGGLVERIVTLSPGRRPEINNRYNSPISVMNGETLLLHCQTTAEPLRLTWTLPSGVVLNRPQRAGRYAIMPNGTLAIRQVSVYDRGSYVCRAANEYGSSVLSLSVIVIAYPPRITSGPPSVTYAKRGVAVQLNCLATGIPKADVAWETPDKMRLVISAQPRLFGNKYLHPQGSLIIQNPTQRDAGIYRCTARNAIGTDTKTTFLNVF
uniref:Ig-like domain-containing protein n=1 Tax=Gouania willdenowi TaxID=441366 RepID=A0A8C5DRY3_GOUWI